MAGGMGVRDVTGGASIAPILIFDRRSNQVASGRLRSANVCLPYDRGSLPALLVGLARVLHWNPAACVVLRSARAPEAWLPGLQQRQQAALELVRHAPDELVMMGLNTPAADIDATRVQTEASGWPGLSRARSIVHGRGEHAGSIRADSHAGELTYSGTVVGRAATFWALVDRLLPELTGPLVPLLAAKNITAGLLATLYRGEGKFDVCRDLLARCPERLWVQEVDGIDESLSAPAANLDGVARRPKTASAHAALQLA